MESKVVTLRGISLWQTKYKSFDMSRCLLYYLFIDYRWQIKLYCITKFKKLDLLRIHMYILNPLWIIILILYDHISTYVTSATMPNPNIQFLFGIVQAISE